MTIAGIVTFAILLLVGIGIILVVAAVTLLALAFIGAPDDLNDVDIKGSPKTK